MPRYRAANKLPREASPRAFETIEKEFERLYRLLSGITTEVETLADLTPTGFAPDDAEYVVGAPDGALPQARVATNSTLVEWDLTTPNVAAVRLAAVAALSVLANATNGSAAPTAIAAAAANTVFKRNGANALEFAKVVLADLESRSESTLLGRGQGAGAGVPQEITIGSGLALTGTVLSATGGAGGYYEPLTDGDTTQPELIFSAGGDVIMVFIP